MCVASRFWKTLNTQADIDVAFLEINRMCGVQRRSTVIGYRYSMDHDLLRCLESRVSRPFCYLIAVKFDGERQLFEKGIFAC